MMTPLAMFGLGVPELLIILAVVLLLFGGSRLAGLGKSTGRALKEFKEETKGLKPEDRPQAVQPPPPGPVVPPQAGLSAQPGAADPQWQQPPVTGTNPSDADFRKDV